MKKLLSALILAGAGLASALGLSPAAHADEGSYLYQLRHNTTANFTGSDNGLLSVGYRICSDWNDGQTAGYIWNQVYYGHYGNGLYWDWTASQEVTDVATYTLCP